MKSNFLPKSSTDSISFKRTCVKIYLGLKQLLCQDILVIGDSHTYVFRHWYIHFSLPRYFFNIVTVPGATISGLKNPNSKTQALSKFQHGIKTSNANTIIVLLGEVDTGFVIWYKAEKYQTTVSEILEQTLGNYQEFLLTLSPKFKVICMSAPLPTIKDYQTLGKVAKARKSVTATQRERTDLTIQFNQKMEDFCQKHGMLYLSLDQESLNSDGLVDEKLFNFDSQDHHYDKKAYAKMIVKKLKIII